MCLALFFTGCASPSAFCPANVIYGKLEGSIVDRHRFDADPDLTFHFHADSDSGPSSSSSYVWESFSSAHNFHILCNTGILKFSGKKYGIAFHLVEMDTDPDPLK
jgi:hypothetical protein